jgi:predicted DNA-binding protein
VDQVSRIRTEEARMSTPDTPGGVKTLAIRLAPDLHQQLAIIASLRNSTLAEEIRQAIETHIVSTKASPDLASKADTVLEDIEREAAARRQAIATLFGSGDQPAKPAAGSRGRKTDTSTAS